ncbi:MAG: GNAT family N-acetyltransferase, partial [Armatimonadota bacterium]
MVHNIGTVRLKSGEDAELYKIICPQPDYKSRLLRRLSHKGDLWEDPMQQALESGLDELTMNFFIVELDEEIVGNITTVQSLKRPVGLLQHVFTDPDHRRKGVCSSLMHAVCEDFRQQQGRAMYLGTGYDTPPFWIYHDYGFRPIGQTGSMVWAPDEEYPRNFFVEGDTQIRETRWEDWPLLNALYQVSEGWNLRGYVYGQFGHSSYESAYCKLRRDMKQDNAGPCVVMQIAETEAVVGHAFVARDKKWPAGPQVLDLFVHPAYVEQSRHLLEAIEIPDGKVQCYADGAAHERIEIIREFGFEHEAVFSKQYTDRDGEKRDVHVFEYQA